MNNLILSIISFNFINLTGLHQIYALSTTFSPIWLLN